MTVTIRANILPRHTLSSHINYQRLPCVYLTCPSIQNDNRPAPSIWCIHKHTAPTRLSRVIIRGRTNVLQLPTVSGIAGSGST